LLFGIEYAVAGLTAFYMFRLYYNVFWGVRREYHHTPHESPLTMSLPLMLLAAATVFTGFIPFQRLVTSDGLSFETHTDLMVAIPSVLVGVLGILVARVIYRSEKPLADRIAAGFGFFYHWAVHKFYFDELYMFLTKRVIFNHISAPIAWFDRHVVDGFMNLLSDVTNEVSFRIRGLQSGHIQGYVFVFVLGAVLLSAYVLLFVTQ
jgi:NADH-quinone oxidoreductase subunit L